jgi:hypothetical protein
MASCIQVGAGGILMQGTGEPSECTNVMLSGSEYAHISTQQQDNSFNAADAGAIFTFFFGVTLGLWFLSKNIGLVLQAIRRF